MLGINNDFQHTRCNSTYKTHVTQDMLLNIRNSAVSKTTLSGSTLSAKFEVDAHRHRMLIKDHIVLSANVFTRTVDIR